MGEVVYTRIKLNQSYFFVSALLVFALFISRNYLLLVFSLVFCSATMIYKRYLKTSIGVDFCLLFTMLAASKSGAVAGIIAGALAFFIGMLISLEFIKSPMMTIYGSLFYAGVAFVYSIIPTSSVYSLYLIHLVAVNIFFTAGAFLLGAPIHFLMKYIPTNIIANLLFLQVFGGVLKLLF